MSASSVFPADVEPSKWSATDVAGWLRAQGFGHPAAKVIGAEIDGASLLKLTDDDMSLKLDMTSRAERIVLAALIKSDLVMDGSAVEIASEEVACPICTEQLREPVVARCGHAFCKSCLQRWLDRNHTCPMDRQDLVKEIQNVSEPLANALTRWFPEAPEHTAQREQESSEQERADREKAQADKKELDGKVRRMKQHFNSGSKLDAGVMVAVLEMCEGDVSAAIKFLELEEGTEVENLFTIDDLTSENGSCPKDFHRNPEEMRPLERVARQGIMYRVISCLTSDAYYGEHYTLQTTQFKAYAGVLKLFLQRRVELPPSARARILAVCFARRDREMSDWLLSPDVGGLLGYHDGKADVFGVLEVLRALKLLDSPRKLRQKKKKLALLEGRSHTKRKTLALLRASINDLEREPIAKGSLSGSLANYARSIIKRIPPAKLEFFALQLPKEPWQELCDMLHIHPTKGTSVEWYLQHVYGADAPAGTVMDCQKLTDASALELMSTYHPPYSFVRTKLPNLPDDCKEVAARTMPLEQCLWYYEELQTDKVDDIIATRLDAGETVSMSFGKLMERLMYFHQNGRLAFFDRLLPMADQALKSLSLSLPPPIVILGDASYSMDVAVRTSSILASVLAALSPGAELRFFTNEAVMPHFVPTNAAQCLELAARTRASGQTAPAAALWEFYDKKVPVNFFVVVSDERENMKVKGLYFHQLFYKYYTEVHKAKLVLISFLEGAAQGQMKTALEALGIYPMQFRLDGRRPDLTKVDGLLGMLAAEAASFESEAANSAEELAAVLAAARSKREKASVVGSKKMAAPKDKDSKKKKKGKSAIRSSSTASTEPESAPAPGPVQVTEDSATQDCAHASAARTDSTAPDVVRGPAAQAAIASIEAERHELELELQRLTMEKTLLEERLANAPN